MASPHIRGLAVAVESAGTGFGNVAAATGVPSTSGLTFASMEVRKGSLSTFGEPVVDDRADEARGGAFIRPAEHVTMYSGGSPIRRLMGSISLTVPVRTIGSAAAFANYGAMPLAQLLSSGMGVHTPSASTVAVAAAGAGTATSWTLDTGQGASSDVGQLVKYDLNGRAEFSAVTSITGDVITASPAYSAAPANSADFRLCQTWYNALGTSTLGSSVALRIDGDGWRWYAYGCRMESVRFYLESRQLMADITLQAAYCDEDHTSAAITEPTFADGERAHSLGSYAVISSASIGTTSPAELARTALDMADFELTYTNTLAPLGHSDDILGMSDMEVTDVAIEGSMTLPAPVAGLEDLYLNGEQRSICIGFGATGAGNGAAVYIPAATMTSDGAVRGLDGDTVQQVLNFGMGNWTLDNSDAGPGDTNFRFGMAL